MIFVSLVRSIVFASACVGLGSVASAQLSFPTQNFERQIGTRSEGNLLKVGNGVVRVDALAGLLSRAEYRGPLTDYAAPGRVLAAALGDSGVAQKFVEHMNQNAAKYKNRGANIHIADSYVVQIELRSDLRLTVALAQSQNFGTDRYLLGKSGPVIREFSDLECPYCKKFHLEAMPGILKRFVDTGKARFSFRHFPLVSIHPQAMPAAIAAECAAKQKKFFPFHDYLFEKGLDFLSAVDALSINVKDFQICRKDPNTQKPILEDMKIGEALKVSGTPTVFVGPFRADNPYDMAAVERLIRMAAAL